jgi:NAD(P)H-flavin reductase/hemoglobin-like flavoprotein
VNLSKGGTEGNPALSSFSRLKPHADAAMTYFYGQLFAIDPEIAAMFPAGLDAQRRRFFHALGLIAAGGDLDPYLERLGRAHRKDGVRERHFEVLRRALLATLRRFCGDSFDAAAWESAFDHAASVMIAAAAADDTPAWWVATVTRTELRAPGIAVLTVHPDKPVPYLPGQHISVQTLHWPRQWRTYSIANAPRPDGTLSLHVRAVDGGMVSHALVHHVAPGDPLVLGAPSGTMTVDVSSPRDVLCLAGGTGLAPIKAIVEALALSGTGPAHSAYGAHSEHGAYGAYGARGKRREIALYFGTRRHRDLYDLPDLRELELAYPWLQVIPAVSGEPARSGERTRDSYPDTMSGTLPELAVRAGWPGRDIYVSGPDTMIVKTVRILRDLGAPPERIHYDLPDEGL